MKTHSLGIAALGLASAFAALPAQAHITMVGALKSRGGDQKSSPCDGKRGEGPVYTFAPGSTITLALDENIPHPGYFRIAFDDDGQDGFKEPQSIKPVEANRACPYDANDQCGESDFCNNETVLWDNLNPHPAVGAKPMSWNVKLPDVECDNCTIQVLQIMEDTIHGAYCPQGAPCASKDSSAEDIYHRCIDIKLVKGTKNGAGATTAAVSNMGMECSKGTTPTDPEPTEPTETRDAGVSAPDEEDGSAPPKRDAAVADEADDADDADDDGETASAGGKKDAGKPPVKKDASVSADDDEAASTGSDEGGCAVAPGAGGTQAAGWSLLALAAGLVARRRKSTRFTRTRG
jgi:MYXO-CTERM domain-containing protein